MSGVHVVVELSGVMGVNAATDVVAMLCYAC